MWPGLLGECDQFFDKRAQFLGFGDGGHYATGYSRCVGIIFSDASGTNEAGGDIAEHGVAVGVITAEFAASKTVSHGSGLTQVPVE